MVNKARRATWQVLSGFARRALIALCVLHAGQMASAQTVLSASYAEPTLRYPHAVLGDAEEYGALRVTLSTGRSLIFRLPEARVFEDTQPRLVDVDGDGAPEVIVVESDQTRGARLAVYDISGLRVATPYIGTRFRWLAPLGAADLDGDGHVEIAFVDRPHLAKTLRIWRYVDGDLRPVADLPGLTNHRIGEPDIAGGIRTCTGIPQMVLATARWARLVAVSFDGTGFETISLGGDTSRTAFKAAMTCEN